MTWKQTWFTISGIDGLILPGMIDEPGCTAGSVISSMPVRGPMTISRRSLAILLRSIASTAQRRAERRGVAHALHQLNAILADAQVEPRDLLQVLVHQRRVLLLDRHARADGAAADAQIAQVIRGLAYARRSARSSEPAYAVNSWPSRIGIASCRCVRPAFTMWSNSLSLLRERVAQRLERADRAPAAPRGSRAECSSGSCRSWTAPCSRDRSDAPACSRRAFRRGSRSRDSRAPRSRSCCATCPRRPDTDRRRTARRACRASTSSAAWTIASARPRVEASGFLVRQRRGLLDPDLRTDERPERPSAADRKVLHRANGLHSVQRIARNGERAERIFLDSRVVRHGHFLVSVARQQGSLKRGAQERAGTNGSATRCAVARAGIETRIRVVAAATIARPSQATLAAWRRPNAMRRGSPGDSCSTGPSISFRTRSMRVPRRTAPRRTTPQRQRALARLTRMARPRSPLSSQREASATTRPAMNNTGSTRPTSAPARVREGSTANAAGATTVATSTAAPNQADSRTDDDRATHAPTIRAHP